MTTIDSLDACIGASPNCRYGFTTNGSAAKQETRRPNAITNFITRFCHNKRLTRSTPYAVTIFLGAFLLFAVQPILGRTLLPLFGGGPAVWTVCLLFFQIGLLAGYLYAHAAGRMSGAYHLAVVAISLWFLPISQKAMPPGLWPELQVLALLAASAGLPYLVLASTGPLLQTWFHEQFPDRSPYRLYSLSNIASMLALASYPVLIEPLLGLSVQRTLWSGGYALYAACCGWCAWSHRQSNACSTNSTKGLRKRDVAWWLALSAAGSIILLAITNQMCQEVASTPFLWILPLAIYLMTFILAFESPRWYSRRWYSRALSLAVPAACAVSAMGLVIPVTVHIAVFSVTLFVCAMSCHGELANARPEPARLTHFYLSIAAGGAIGGTLAALGAPLVFTSYLEFPLGLSLCCALILLRILTHDTTPGLALHQRLIPCAGLILAAIGPLAFLSGSEPLTSSSFRNFYGTLRLRERTSIAGPQREMRHGRITHGFQFIEQSKRSWPTSYYGPSSGVGLAINKLSHPASIGVIGLGAGTLAAYGKPGDRIRFYEINPDVIALSKRYFSFQRDSAARVEVIEGDARIRLEQEPEPLNLDLLAVDAFSSDAIPTHLLTVECADIYRRHLKPGGVLAIHISNQSLDLAPVVVGMARHLGLQAMRIDSPEDQSHGTSTAIWMLLSGKSEGPPPPSMIVWTDDHVSLWRIMRWR